MCSSDCEARSMATKRQRVSTRSSDSSVADKKRRQVSVATVTVVAALYDGRARSMAVPFERRVFQRYVTGFHETACVQQGRTQANCTT